MASTRKRLFGLDILRAAAVVLVIGRHLHWDEPLPPMLAAIKRGGWIGVDVFFVLSGFLIARLIFQEYSGAGTVELGRFLLRRAWKIYPSFYVCIAVTVLVRMLIGHCPAPWQVAAECLFLQNFSSGLWIHTWSLAVEEHFYLLLATLVYVLVRTRPRMPFRPVPAIFLIVAVVCLGFRRLWWSIHSQFDLSILFQTQYRIDSLMFGVVLAYLWQYGRLRGIGERVASGVWLAAGAILLAPAFFYELEDSPWITVYGLPLFAGGAGCLLMAAIRVTPKDSVFVNVVAWLGSASYPIYLWHIAVMTWGWKLATGIFGDGNLWAYVAWSYAGTFIVGICMAYLVERPTLAIRDRVCPSRMALTGDAT